MIESIKQAIQDYMDTHTPLQLARDALPYLIAVVAAAIILRWVRSKRKSKM